MKKVNLISLISVITMFIILFLPDFFNLKSLSIIGIVVIVPISIFVQGIICSIRNKGLVVSLLISLLALLFLTYNLFKSDVYVYLIYYGAVYLIGYAVGILILKFKNK